MLSVWSSTTLEYKPTLCGVSSAVRSVIWIISPTLIDKLTLLSNTMLFPITLSIGAPFGAVPLNCVDWLWLRTNLFFPLFTQFK